jgi:hypothetical protein
MRAREELMNDDIAAGRVQVRTAYPAPAVMAPEEYDSVTITRPVNRVRVRCLTCQMEPPAQAARDWVYEPVGEAWATTHEREALDKDDGRVHRVEISVTYHEIGLSADHEKYFRRWSAGIRDDLKKNIRRRDFTIPSLATRREVTGRA